MTLPDEATSTSAAVTEEAAVSSRGSALDGMLIFFKASVISASLVVNVLGLIAVFTGRRWHQAMGVLLLFRLVVNLSLTIFSMPLSLAAGYLGGWYFGRELCYASAYLTGFLLRAELAGHALVCLDRFVAIRFPYTYIPYGTPKTALISTAVTITGLLVLQGGTLGLAEDVDYAIRLENCFPTASVGYVLRVAVVVYYVICYGIIIYSTIKVAVIARRHRRQIAVQDRLQPEDIRGLEAEILRNYQAVWWISLWFVVLSVPVTLVILTLHDRVPIPVSVFGMWILYSNSFISTLIYQTRTKQFREDIRLFFNKCRIRARVGMVTESLA